MGSSPQSGIWAAQRGLPYAFADFIQPTGVPIASRYREEFRPSEWLDAPQVVVAAWVLCAETDAEAERLVSSSRMAMTLLTRGQLIPVPSVETAQRFLEAQGSLSPRPWSERRVIIGSPATVKPAIEALAREYGASEVMVVTITHEHAARLRSYELIAQAFGLT